MRTECQRILIHFLLLISHKLLAISKLCLLPYSLPDLCFLYLIPYHSLISIQSLPDLSLIESCFSLPSNFWCSWVDGDVDRYSYLWNAEAVLLNLFLASEAANLKPPSKIDFLAPIPSQIFKNIAHRISIRLTLKPQPNKHVPPMRSPERPPHPHTTSQRPNGKNHHFHLGLLSATDPPAPQ